MAKRIILLLLIGLFAFLALTGCESYTTQTTSGSDYLSSYPTSMGQASADIDAQVREIANIEPTLNFPARIGLAKLYNGKITNLSPEEVEAWNKARGELGPEYGAFVPISSLIAESVYTPPVQNYRGQSFSNASELIKKVRLGSARQHLDVALIYEVFSESKTTTLASSVADWTTIGGYLIPSKEIETTGYANALLIDVRTGYPYGTASASLSKDELGTTWGNRDQLRDLKDRNQIATALKLVPEVKKMVQDLKAELN